MMHHELLVLEAEPSRGFVVMIRTQGMMNPVGPRLYRKDPIDQKFQSPFYPTKQAAEEARAAWESYIQEHHYGKQVRKISRKAAAQR